MTVAAVEAPTLHVSRGLALPLEYVTKACAILAQRRKGKTYTAAVIAEELVKAKQPFVALDPTGAWWGLRASADGEQAGLPVVVIGGQHGDLPLERGAGAFVADLVLDHPGWYVLDLSLLDSRSAEREFATAFAERLYRRKMQPGMDFPLHLFVDEADMFVPQEKEGTGDVRMLGAFQAIVRRGGLHGLGATLISQRPALINKSVLTQLDLLILLRLVAGNDQDAVDKNYVSRSSTKEQRSELMGSLASLPVGEAWFFEPGAEPEPLFRRVKVRARRTFNSSATPKPGEARVEPRVLAPVDLDELREGMAETIERLKDDDPAELRKRLRAADERLTKQARSIEDLTARLDERAASVEVERIVEVPVKVVSKADLDAAADLILKATEAAEQMKQVGAALSASVHVACQPLAQAIVEATDAATAKAEAPPAGRREEREQRVPSRPAVPRDGRVGTSAAATPPARATEPLRHADGVTGPQQKILDALAWWRAVGVRAPSVGQVAFVVGNHARSKGFTNNLSALSTARLVERMPGTVSLTDAGAEAARAPLATPTSRALQEMIYAQVGPAKARLLSAVVARNGEWVTLDQLAEEMESHPRSKGFTNNVSSLSGLGLLERNPGRVRATDLCYLP